ncbi:MAG TPA: L-threonylcarbamoyladenylate synthase [Acetobacteraceae bacterium]|nr:L-threonylcarbamoyladenylate synthase [Acetobacteraceae bacterium]
MTELLTADRAGLRQAAALLRAGELVAFGTETVYGLGADATNARAVAAIFDAKQRPRFNPLICHYADAAAAFADVLPNPVAELLGERLWPGPLTLVLPRRPGSRVALLTGAGLDTLAVRVPSHPVARALIAETGRPIAAPSANRSGRVSPTTAQDVVDELGGRIAAVLDCGVCTVGVESTVLDLTGERPSLLRPGGATLDTIQAVAGPVLCGGGSGEVRSPGMLMSHYAPLVPLRLNAQEVSPDEALLAFGTPVQGAAALFNLSARRDLTEAAARLFSGLRHLDAAAQARGLARIAAMPVPETGLGMAINDRLRRAAAPREGG